jgi:hypothetical protein
MNNMKKILLISIAVVVSMSANASKIEIFAQAIEALIGAK